MSCDHENTTFTETPEYVHYGRRDCEDCGEFLGWVEKPGKDDRDTTSQYTIEQIIKKKGFDEARCFFCRRPRAYLGKNETLTRDHIHELQDGGEDRIDNLQILCTACHKLKNHNRLYYHKHLKGFFNGGTQ
ncbi:HNH endonuclease [Halogeometricum borinquense]|uniref:HNH endonuclease n=1 Tax=Halogeometricum borinquense TaxID=60847 RepID=A0A6C0UIS9_9EURY|nr:HNH endonuclease [Halogeometricum borinquense]QIB75402.1 HNH endonuclease [Halogeometricum borinquense]